MLQREHKYWDRQTDECKNEFLKSNSDHTYNLFGIQNWIQLLA